MIDNNSDTTDSPTLYLLIGPSGCGKSTFAKALCESTGAIRLNADTMRGVICGDEGNQDVSVQAFKQLGVVAEYHAYLGDDMVVDNLNLRAKARRQWIDIVKKGGYDYHVVAYVFRTDFDTCAERISARYLAGGMRVPGDVMEGQFGAYSALIDEGDKGLAEYLSQEGIGEVRFINKDGTEEGFI